MSYTVKNFKSKKELKQAVATKEQVRCFQPGLGPDLTRFNGTIYLEGPHYPKPHKWYAQAKLKDGVVVGVK